MRTSLKRCGPLYMQHPEKTPQTLDYFLMDDSTGADRMIMMMEQIHIFHPAPPDANPKIHGVMNVKTSSTNKHSRAVLDSGVDNVQIANARRTMPRNTMKPPPPAKKNIAGDIAIHSASTAIAQSCHRFHFPVTTTESAMIRTSMILWYGHDFATSNA